MSLRIEPYDLGRYFVSAGGGTYLVDVAEFKGNGFCGCRDFEYRHLPALQKEEECGIEHQPRQCKHIKAVMAWLNPTTAQVQNKKEGEEAARQGDRRNDEEKFSNWNPDGPSLFLRNGRWYDVHGKHWPEFDGKLPRQSQEVIDPEKD